MYLDIMELLGEFPPQIFYRITATDSGIQYDFFVTDFQKLLEHFFCFFQIEFSIVVLVCKIGSRLKHWNTLFWVSYQFHVYVLNEL